MTPLAPTEAPMSCHRLTIEGNWSCSPNFWRPCLLVFFLGRHGIHPIQQTCVMFCPLCMVNVSTIVTTPWWAFRQFLQTEKLVVQQHPSAFFPHCCFCFLVELRISFSSSHGLLLLRDDEVNRCPCFTVCLFNKDSSQAHSQSDEK